MNEVAFFTLDDYHKVMRKLLPILILILLFACSKKEQPAMADQKDYKPAVTKEALFAGGCFWCTESDFEKVDGVVEAISGYVGGDEKDPTYKQVSAGKTGHYEAIRVIYDPAKITYTELLDVFWRHVDPTDPTGQFVDKGKQYRSAIFYINDEQKNQAEESKKKMDASGRFNKPIVTEILKAKTFYDAEEYHQDYYKKNPIRYKYYRSGSGRDDYLDDRWGTSKEDH